MTFIDICCRDE